MNSVLLPNHRRKILFVSAFKISTCRFYVKIAAFKTLMNIGEIVEAASDLSKRVRKARIVFKVNDKIYENFLKKVGKSIGNVN